jgi:flagellar biogenesis protein FliO
VKYFWNVGMVALIVTSLTVAQLSANPSATTSNRDWLRKSAPQAASGAAPAKSSIGKWTAAALLLGISGFALWQRKKQRQSSTIATFSPIKIHGGARLSAKAQLVIVTVGGRTMLLGVTETNVNRLAWLSGDAQPEDESEELDDASGGERGSTTTAPNSAQIEAQFTGKSAPYQAMQTIGQEQTTRRPLRFRDVIADAIGLTPRTPAANAPSRAPVDEIALLTEDRYIGGSQRQNPVHPGKRPAQSDNLINVEGQAAGLVARLNRPQQ